MNSIFLERKKRRKKPGITISSLDFFIPFFGFLFWVVRRSVAKNFRGFPFFSDQGGKNGCSIYQVLRFPCIADISIFFPGIFPTFYLRNAGPRTARVVVAGGSID